MQWTKRCVLFFVLIFAGCASPYASLSEAQSGAYFTGRSNANTHVILNNEKRCYVGEVNLPHPEPGQLEAAKPVRIEAEKQTAVVYENLRMGVNGCRAIGGFVPVKDHHYVAVGGEMPRPGESVLERFLTPYKDACMVSVYDVLPDGKLKQVELTELRPRQRGIACIRFEP